MKYQTVVGLELHCELNTKSKVFSSAKNNYDAIPNSNVKPLDMAFPGNLPVVNKEAVKKALKMATCLNCEIPEFLMFDRKNYYYPDLPKGYQITQTHNSVGINGKLLIDVNGKDEEVLIHDIHLEEDTASLDHLYNYSLIDYNRSGVPLVEIVTEPCIYSAEAAVSFLESLVGIFKYCDISEADTKKRQIRCDVNVNLKDPITNQYLTPKVEIKNINSFSNVASAINYEVKRHIEALESGNKDSLVQETRRYDEASDTTIRMRVKVESVDYKYFVEPNIPIINIDKEWLKEIKKEIPELAFERTKKYINNYNLSHYDASIIVKDIDIANYFEECIKLGIDPKLASNWITSEILGILNKENLKIKDFFITPEMLFQILDKMNRGEISSKQAKEVFNKSLNDKVNPKELLSNYSQISNEEELITIINNILDNNKNLIEEYKNGKNNVFDYFIGQIMKETKGKANPVLTRDLLKKEINKK